MNSYDSPDLTHATNAYDAPDETNHLGLKRCIKDMLEHTITHVQRHPCFLLFSVYPDSKIKYTHSKFMGVLLGIQRNEILLLFDIKQTFLNLESQKY